MMGINSLTNITDQLIEFRDERDWRKFHTLKGLIISLNLEASELLELTQWVSDEKFDRLSMESDINEKLTEECADVFIYLLLIAERIGLDLCQAASNKIKINDEKYPVEKSRGVSTKYSDL